MLKGNIPIWFFRVFFPALLAVILTVEGFARPADDLFLFRPSNNTWFRQSVSAGAFSAIRWGMAGDVPVAADYDGDEIKDVAVWRPANGRWYISRSSDGNLMIFTLGAGEIDKKQNNGLTAAITVVPVPADYDGDGLADIAIWEPDSGIWRILYSINGFKPEGGAAIQWGNTGDIPVQADYDGDGKADLAVFRPDETRWLIRESITGSEKTLVFGHRNDNFLIPSDYTGDGKADIAIFRKGVWHLVDSDTGISEEMIFGFADSIPAPGDYDGDGITDFAVFTNSAWHIYQSSGPRFVSLRFGTNEDVPPISLRARQNSAIRP